MMKITARGMQKGMGKEKREIKRKKDKRQRD